MLRLRSPHKLTEGFVKNLPGRDVPLEAASHPLHHLNSLKGGRLRVPHGLPGQYTLLIGEYQMLRIGFGNQ